MRNFITNRVIKDYNPLEKGIYYGNNTLFTSPLSRNNFFDISKLYQEIIERPLKNLAPYLKPNWDGEGAVPISPVTLQHAQTFLSMLLPNVPKVKAAPGIDGSIGLFWKTSVAYLYVDIYPDEEVVYYYKLGRLNPLEQEGLQEAPFDAQKLYEQLQEAYRFLSKNTLSERYEVSSYIPRINLAMSHYPCYAR